MIPKASIEFVRHLLRFVVFFVRLPLLPDVKNWRPRWWNFDSFNAQQE